MPPVHFEDLTVGDGRELGTRTVTREEMVEFAERYDPQPFHVDATAASDSPFDGLVASGWYTAACCMRLLVEGFLSEAATAGAVGVDRLRWPAPVRPGDALAVRLDVAEKADWDDDRGLVHLAVTATNDRDEEVLTMVGLVLFARREPATP